MALRTVLETVENGEQDTILKVLQIYNQEVSERRVVGLMALQKLFLASHPEPFRAIPSYTAFNFIFIMSINCSL